MRAEGMPSVEGGFRTVYADPPWPESGGGRIRRGADAHYRLLSVCDIVSLMRQVPTARDCHLWLWATNNHLEDALFVMKALGFRYVTNRVWVKNGRPGLGQYVRGCHELLLFGVRGSLPYKRGQGRVRSHCTVLSVVVADRREHSRKPDSVYRDVEAVSFAPYIELFARMPRPGWSSWGAQLAVSRNE